MLEKLPLFHFFDCGNTYCGEHKGMRYYADCHKTEEGEKHLRFTVWPEPWEMDYTPAQEKTTAEFSFDQQGVDDGLAWLRGQYDARADYWKAAMNEPWSVSVQKRQQAEKEAKEAEAAAREKQQADAAAK